MFCVSIVFPLANKVIYIYKIGENIACKLKTSSKLHKKTDHGIREFGGKKIIFVPL
jgi:hypothetical protein